MFPLGLFCTTVRGEEGGIGFGLSFSVRAPQQTKWFWNGLVLVVAAALLGNDATCKPCYGHQFSGKRVVAQRHRQYGRCHHKADGQTDNSGAGSGEADDSGKAGTGTADCSGAGAGSGEANGSGKAGTGRADCSGAGEAQGQTPSKARTCA